MVLAKIVIVRNVIIVIKLTKFVVINYLLVIIEKIINFPFVVIIFEFLSTNIKKIKTIIILNYDVLYQLQTIIYL